MTTYIKQIFFYSALLAAGFVGAWVTLDTAQAIFEPHTLEARANSNSFQPYCDLPPSCTMWASSQNLTGTGDVTIYWDSTNTVGGEMDHSIGSLGGAGGSIPIYNLSQTTTFHTRFWNSVGDYAYCSTTVTVTPPPPPSPTCTLDVSDSSITNGQSTTLSWTTTNASSVSINQNIGSVSANGSKSVSPSTTTTYTLSATGNGKTVQCQRTVTVTTPPPPKGCIAILKETFDPNGAKLSPVAQFTFKLDGNQTAVNDANGNATFTNVTPGTHTVTEVSAGSTWKQLSVTPANGSVVVSSGSQCAGVVFKNQQVVPPPGKGCIAVTKQTLDPTGANLTPVAQFTFKLDGNQTAVNDASGHATFTNVTPGTHTVTEVSGGSTWSLIAQSPSNGVVTVASGSQCANVSFVNKQVITQNPPSCTLTASPTSLNAPGSTTLSWTTVNATSASIDQGIGNVSPLPSGSRVANVSANTTFTLTVTGANGQTANCSVPITVTGPSCALSISASNILTGQSAILSWVSSGASSGTIDNNIGTVSPVSGGSVTVFPPSSTTYTGTFVTPSGNVTCSVPITVTPPGGGCTNNCPGGLDQPNVSLFKQPNEQPLAFVSLSQIPYTGFEAGPALTLIFWLAVAGLSAFIAYGIAGQGSFRHLLTYVVGGFMGMPIASASRERDVAEAYGRPYPAYDQDADTSYMQSAPVAAPSSHAPLYAAPYIAPVPKAARPPVAPLPEVADVIESRAHAAGVLMSPEAVNLAVGLSRDRAEALRIFGTVLNEAVRVIPREDGWIMLTADRMKNLASVHAPSAPASRETMEAGANIAPSLDENAAAAFAGAVVSGNREDAFAIIRSLEHDNVKPTALMTMTATVLDHLYRARRDARQAPNAELADKAAHVSDEALAHLVEIFTHALDHVYTSPFTGVKLALAQAFETVA